MYVTVYEHENGKVVIFVAVDADVDAYVRENRNEHEYKRVCV